MRLTVLSDNRTLDPSLETEHGLCVHLDTGNVKVLLDTGASDVFLRNASVLGIDIHDVDFVFISHGHSDHAGGLVHLLEKNDKAKVIVSPVAMSGSFLSSRKGMHDISAIWPEMVEDRLICVSEEMEIAGLRIIPHIGRNHSVPKANRCLYIMNSDGTYVQDDFRHEMALQTGDFLFSGCAHNGLMNILESSSNPVRTVLGGFHLLDSLGKDDFESDSEIRDIASDLLSRYPDTVFYTGHCTGDRTFVSMKEILGHNLQQFSCGMSVEI